MTIPPIKRIKLVFSFAWICLIAIGILSYLSVRESVNDAGMVSHTNRVMQQIEVLAALNSELNSTQRSYVLTGKAAFKESHVRASGQLQSELRELTELLDDNPEQLARLQKVQGLLQQHEQAFEAAAQLRESGRMEDIAALDTSEFRAKNAAEIDVNLTLMDEVEKGLLVSRISQNDNSKKLVGLLIGFGSFFACLCVWLARWLVVKDLAEREKVAEQLKESQERFILVANATQDCVWDWNLATNFLWWNEGVRTTFGYEKADVVNDGEWWVDKIHPDDRDRVVHGIDAAFEDPSMMNWSGEYRFRRKDNTYCDVFDRGIILRNAEGKSLRMLGSVMDMTERKAMHNELIEAREKAVESSRLKSEFLANMSHEIRTPMNGVIGMTGLLLDTPLEPLQLEYAQTIRGCAESLLTVINDILDFSKIEAGKLGIEKSDFELRTIVESCMELLAPEAHKKNLEFLCFIDPDLPHSVVGDAGRIRQMLINFLSNALKFTEKGEILVQVKPDLQPGAEGRIRFEVIDTGIGISAEHQAKLFQAFTQADGSTARKYGGTGLGLAISKHLVTLMEGDIGLISQPGHGSNFWFSLPLPKAAIQIVKPSQTLADLANRSCLVVDDNETNRRIVHHQVISWGMKNSSASSPQEALVMLRKAADDGRPFDIAVLDMHMPSMSGVELALAIGQDPLIAHTHLILMSSVSKAATEAELARAKISVYLTKPVRQSHLYNCFVELLSGAKPRKTTPTKLLNPESKPPQKTHTTRILIAEDNAINQRIALSQLEKLGYKAEAVGNGEEALQATLQIDYDLIFMDCQMPEMDGYEATRQLRKREGSKKHTIIIAMTANAVEGDREKCIAAGMDDYIGKPVDVRELKKMLETWANPRKAHA